MIRGQGGGAPGFVREASEGKGDSAVNGGFFLAGDAHEAGAAGALQAELVHKIRAQCVYGEASIEHDEEGLIESLGRRVDVEVPAPEFGGDGNGVVGG